MNHDLFMLRCLQIAQRAKGYTSPNPMVGAVLVHNGKIIGEGWHQNYGADHAEINCLNNVDEKNKHLICESTMYVNLEPCAHYGNTPPCSVRLVKEKIKQIYISNLDPFEKVSGKGIKILKDGGVSVETGLMEKEGFWVNRRFFCFQNLLRPYIILKWAKTSDGFIAENDNKKTQISNSVSMQLNHKWRTEESAIMIGTKTALTDNPQLTARLWHGKQPLRIVLDRNLFIPKNNFVFNNSANTWVINEQKDEQIDNVRYVKLLFNTTFLELLMKKLYEAQILSVIIEGGAKLLTSFIDKGSWDEARVFTSKLTFGDGIATPQIKNGTLAYSTNLADDYFELFTNRNNKYSYPLNNNIEI